jgi:hypothetical protein
MNFQHMPELQYQNGYYIVIGAMVLMGLLWCFISEEKMVLNRVVIIERIICRETMQSVKIEYLMKIKKDKSRLLKGTVMQLLKVLE